MKTRLFFLLPFLFLIKLHAQIVNIPDVNFKAALLAGNAQDTNGNYIYDLDANNDGEIQETEAKQVYKLILYGDGIHSLEGIKSFVNLQVLDCGKNLLSTLDLQGLSDLKILSCDSQIANGLALLNLQDCTNLEEVYCFNNQITSLNIKGCVNLQKLLCYYNNLTSLNVRDCTNLAILDCADNQLTSLDLHDLTNLQVLNCNYNQINSLDIKGCTNFYILSCSSNQLFFLSLDELSHLKKLYCDHNQLTTLELQNCSSLEYFDCSNNQLETILMKNESFQAYVIIHDNPSLRYICCDEIEKSYVQSLVSTNITVTSDCSLLQTENISKTKKISVFPNPVKDILNLETSEKIKKVEILDLSGRLMKANLKVENNKISVSDIVRGYYILKVYTEHSVIDSKFIKE
ncbi:leucine-rich repeat domain-containing protein [Epilithonimonas caeni]|uniref:leucine-rich repeat domain-containing protein n=1 Tax=Epilithonimonas caeni TaxID=365343 RepID=UPI00040A61F5|nr:leucine-rich repeat domain-containing protein [Epilithonimonas caeni]